MNNDYISIIILAHNRLDVTKRCINSIINRTWQTPYELILIYNGGPEGDNSIEDYFATVKHYFQYLNSVTEYKDPTLLDIKLKSVIIKSNSENIGLQPGRNQGMALATGKWMMWLDNDAWITDDYLRIPKRPLDWTYTTDTLGRFVYWLKNKREQSGEICILGQTGSYWGPDRVNDRIESKGLFTEVDAVMGYNVAFDREVYDVSGPIDEFYGVRGRQDTEFCFNAKANGFHVYRSGYIGIDHISGNVNGARYEKKFHENSKYMINKWREPENAKRLHLIPRDLWVR